MVWLVGAVVLLWIAFGPYVLLLAVGLLAVPRLRWWVQDRAHVSRRAAAWTAGALAAVVAVGVLAPDGWLPAPQAPGVWAGPGYVGRPASAHPVEGAPTPANPQRVTPDPADHSGPLGLQPEVDTAWLGLQRCDHLAVTPTDRVLASCHSRSADRLLLVDPESMRPGDTLDLPARPDGSDCAVSAPWLDASGRAVLAAGDRQVLAVPTGQGRTPGLGKPARWDLKPWVPWGDCVVSLAPDWSGRLWWASAAGLVGTLDPATGQVGVVDLGEPVSRQVTTGDDGAYVVTHEALHRLVAGADGTPQPAWRAAYDGTSGSAPVLLAGGTVAITDESDDRLGVRFLARDDGSTRCRRAVFEEGDGATASDLVPVGSGVLVVNNAGYSSPGSTLLGFTTDPGIARVDLVDGECPVTWTSDAVSPSGGVTLSRPGGVVYAVTKRPSLTGVSAWYLTALDARTGRRTFGVRTGTGMVAGNDGSEVVLDGHGSAWFGTLTGLVRIHDRRR